jgi:hypothetical protein
MADLRFCCERRKKYVRASARIVYRSASGRGVGKAGDQGAGVELSSPLGMLSQVNYLPDARAWVPVGNFTVGVLVLRLRGGRCQICESNASRAASKRNQNMSLRERNVTV